MSSIKGVSTISRDIGAVSRQESSVPSLLAWLPPSLIGLLMLALSRYAGDGISDPDTLWHIRAGDVLRNNWDFAGGDPLSSFTHGPWILNQWLPELVMSFVYEWGGLQAISWLTTVGRVAVVFAVYAACRRQAAQLPAAVITSATVVGVAGGLSPRPQLVAFILLTMTVGAWLATARDLKPRWWLLAMSWVWASTHGTWTVGVMIGIVASCGLVLDNRLSPRAAFPFVSIPFASTALAAVTPVGLQLFKSFGTVKAVSPYIQEWQRPSLGDPATLAVLGLATIAVLAWARHRELVSWSHGGLLVVGLAWAAAYTRTVPVGALIIAPIAAAALGRMLGRNASGSKAEFRFVAGCAVTALVVGAILAAKGPEVPTAVPHRFDSVLGALPAKSVVFNDDALGGWLIFTHPELRQTADTRAELYGPQAARTHLAIMAARPGWEEHLDSLQPAAIIIRAEAPLARALKHRGGWRVVGYDDGFALYEPTATP